MSYEFLVGLQVIDDTKYTDYREAMMPLLESVGGGFRYDFKVSDVLKSEGERPINRVFAIYFESKRASESFFSNPEYLEIRKKFFDPSVGATTMISQYER